MEKVRSNKNRLDILWLRERFPWMGNYSGYDQLFNRLEKDQRFRSFSVYRDMSKHVPPGMGKITRYISIKAGATKLYNQQSAMAELKALWNGFFKGYRIFHITYLENNLGLLGKYAGIFSSKVIATAHQPFSWWKSAKCQLDILKRLDALIVLGREEFEYFNRILPGKVFFIHHGVDTTFFHPPAESFKKSLPKGPRLLFVGHWLRDTATLAKVIQNVCLEKKNVTFDLVVPDHARRDPSFQKLAKVEQVTWHSRISDEKLRLLYWNADLLILPLIDCTANNAVLESMACALPIVTSDIGGIRDYADESFAEIIPPGDVDGMVESVMSLLNNSIDRHAKGQLARLFVNENFSLSTIAEKTSKVYERMSA